MGSSLSTTAGTGEATTTKKEATKSLETSPAPAPTTVVEERKPSKETKKKVATAKSGLKAMLKYDGRLEQLISPELMCYLQSVHEEKGEPVFLWGYHMNFPGDHIYGKEIHLLEENSIYTSDYDEIFENIDSAMPIWKGNDRLLVYEDGNVEVRVAFADRKHARHFLHCFACYCNGDSWPRNDNEWNSE